MKKFNSSFVQVKVPTPNYAVVQRLLYEAALRKPLQPDYATALLRGASSVAMLDYPIQSVGMTYPSRRKNKEVAKNTVNGEEKDNDNGGKLIHRSCCQKVPYISSSMHRLVNEVVDPFGRNFSGVESYLHNVAKKQKNEKKDFEEAEDDDLITQKQKEEEALLLKHSQQNLNTMTIRTSIGNKNEEKTKTLLDESSSTSASMMIPYDEYCQHMEKIKQIASHFDEKIFVSGCGPQRRGHLASSSLHVIMTQLSTYHGAHEKYYIVLRKFLRALMQDGYAVHNAVHRHGEHTYAVKVSLLGKEESNSMKSEEDDDDDDDDDDVLRLPEWFLNTRQVGRNGKKKERTESKEEGDSSLTKESLSTASVEPRHEDAEVNMKMTKEEFEKKKTPMAKKKNKKKSKQPKVLNSATVRTLFIHWATYDRYFPQLILRTGGTDFGEEFRCRSQLAGYELSDDGLMRKEVTGQVVTAHSEKEVFERVYMPYTHPIDR